jgi:hypothetical protein
MSQLISGCNVVSTPRCKDLGMIDIILPFPRLLTIAETWDYGNLTGAATTLRAARRTFRTATLVI